jgi:hypothetical protein
MVVSVATLVTLVAVFGAIAWGRRVRELELQRRRSTMRALRTMRALADDCAHTTDAEAAACRALREVLGLRDCWYEPVAGADLPVIDADGTVRALVQRGTGAGLVLPAMVALPVGDGGRFVLVGDPDVGLSPERRQVAVAMASLLQLAPLRGRARS